MKVKFYLSVGSGTAISTVEYDVVEMNIDIYKDWFMEKMSATQEKEFREGIKERNPDLPKYLIDSHVMAKNKYLASINREVDLTNPNDDYSVILALTENIDGTYSLYIDSQHDNGVFEERYEKDKLLDIVNKMYYFLNNWMLSTNNTPPFRNDRWFLF